MSRMDSFLAWLKGEGGEDPRASEEEQKTEAKRQHEPEWIDLRGKSAVSVPGEMMRGVVSEEAFDTEKTARAKAEERAGRILSDVKPEIIRAGIRAGMPAKLVETTVETLAKSQDWEGLKSFWDDAKATTEKTIKPGTSADRGLATEDDATPEARRNRYRTEAKEIVGRVVPTNGKGRE